MTTLFKINQDLDQICEEIYLLELEGQKPSQDLIDKLFNAMNEEGEKIDSCCMYIHSAQGEIEVYKNHIKGVQADIKKLEKSIEYLKGVADLAMKSRGLKELKGKFGHKFSYRRSSSVEITDSEALPESVINIVVIPSESSS